MAYEDLFDPADNTKAKAGINLRYGIEAAPDLAARDAALAKRYGLPAGVIEQYRPDYDARAKVEDAGRMLDQSPKLRDWLAADPVRAKVSHDDIGNLSAIEKGIRYLVSAPDAPRGGLISDVGRAGKAIASGAPSAGGALYGAAASIAGLADQYVQTLDDLAALLTGTEKRQIVGTPGPESWLLDQQKQARGVAQGMLPDMQGMSPEERGLWSGLQSGGQNLLTLPLGIVGGEAMMLGTMGAFTFGQSYGKGREKLSPVQSVGFAAQDTVAEVVTEKYLGAGGLLKNIKAGQSAGKLFMYELSKEVPGEIAATIWQNFNEWLNVSPDKSVADFVMEQPDAIRETIVATLVGGTTQIGAVKGVEKVMGLGSNEMDRAMRAEKSALGLDQLSKLVEASKLRERSPEKLAEFTQQLTEESVPNVYVNGTALNQSGVDLQALAEALPSVAAQVQRAVATGGDIVIPTAEFLTITPGQPFAKALIEHARTAPDAMSKAEGTQWMKENGDALQAEIAKVLETRQADDAFQADRQAVQDQFLAQLTQTKRFRPEVNKAYATLLSDFYAAQASRAGMTAQELAQRYPVRIQATAPGGGRSYQQDQQLMVLRTAAVDASKAFDAMDAAAAGGEQVDPDEYMRLAEEHSNAQDALSTGIAAIPDEVFGLQAETRDGRLLVLNASAQQAGKWQLTRFDKDGVPFMDTQHDTKLFAVKEFVHESDPASIKSYDQTLNQSAQLPATIDIDGQQRPTTNSKGQPIAATEEGVRNFWRWFGDSKVVDGDGRPLVVYHGTKGNFDSFNPGKLGSASKATSAKGGFFFAAEPDRAAFFSELGKDRDYVEAEQQNNADSKKFFKLKKDLLKVASKYSDGVNWPGDRYVAVLGAKDGTYHPAVVAVARELKVLDDKITEFRNWPKPHAVMRPGYTTFGGRNTIPVYLSAVNPKVVDFGGADRTHADLTRAINKTKKDGYDSLIAKNIKDPSVGDNYIVFNPEQIKSAIGNRGTFDPNDASILNQSARGQISFGQDITQAPSVISLFDGADFSTLIHESGHFFLEAHMDLAARIAGRVADGEQVSDGERGIVADANALLGWFGVKGSEQAGGAAGGALEQPAYHGTPHRGIDRFSTDKIGTGEGAQAYGWGIYLASRRDVAEYYRKSVSDSRGAGFAIAGNVPTSPNEGLSNDEAVATKDLAELFVPDSKVIQTFGGLDVVGQSRVLGMVRRLIQNRKVLDSVVGLVPIDVVNMLGRSQFTTDGLLNNPSVLIDLLPANPDDFVPGSVQAMDILAPLVTLAAAKVHTGASRFDVTRAAVERAAAGAASKDQDNLQELYRKIPQPSEFVKGQLYEVDIPEDSEMLLWDKPLSDQPDVVRKSANSLRGDLSQSWLDDELERINADWDELTGQDLYKLMQKALVDDALIPNAGSQAEDALINGAADKAASLLLMDDGIKGIKYLDGTSRAAGDGSFNYVIFSGDDVAIKNTFYQGGEQPEQSGPSPMGRTPLETWLMMSIDERRQMHEQFARGFEAYAFEGKSPSQALNGIFAKFRAWMLSVYKSLKSLNVTLTDEVRQVMDRMLATDEQIAEQQAALKMGPLFATAEQAGMTPEQWAQYQGLAEQATQQAVEALERRAMKDMAWQRNATARALKAAQRRAAGVRREVEREVRAEVMSRPVYRAWQFLTGKGDPIDTAIPAPKERKSKALDNANDNLFTAIAKLGGLDKAELKAQWGLDTTAEELKSGVFGMPVVRRDNGHSIDRMAEMLVEEGYLLPDENGKANLADLEEAFDAQRRGEDIYSTWYDYAERYKDRGPDLLPDNAIFGKLRTEDLRERYGTGETAIWRKLSDLRMTSDANGIDPDVVAASFEFGSGDELVRALVDARAPQAVIDEETDARMLQEFGDISSPEALQKAADEAVHNEVRARAIAAELSALEEANNVKQKIPGTRRTVDLLAKAAKDYADGVIRALKVRDVRPAQYAAAEVRAANAAAKAFKKGDTAAAAEAKRNQLIQNLAAKAAHKAQADIDSALAYFKRMQKPGKLPAAHFEQIQALLSKFDLRASQSLKSIDNATRHRTWVKAQLDAGNVPPNVDALLTKEQRAAYLRELESRNDDGDLIYPNEEDQALLLAGYIDATPVRSYKEATVEEIIGLRDTIKQIEHIGRRTKKVLADRKNREFQAVVDEMRDRLVEVATKRGRKATDTRSPNDKAGQKRLSWRGYFFSHIKVANLLHIMDGGAGGPMWEHLMKTANDAANGEVLDVAKAHNEIQALLKDVKALGDITDKAIHFPSIGRSLNRQARIVMAMNLGNESNQQRLLAGEGWTMAQVKPVLDTLTAADWKFVQGMWDHFESYRERVGDMEKLINGVEPEWVEARPFSVKAAGGEIIMMRGGYAPVIYDPRANGRAQSFAAEKDAKDMMQAARVASTVSKSFTKARVEEVKGRPLMLSLDAMIGGVQDTIHYLHWQPWIIDANRMIKALDAPLREHYGAEVVKQLREWAGDNAAGVRPARDAAERAVTNLARNVSFAGLAFNVLSAAKQVTGYSQSVAVIGSKWMGKGVAHTLKSPRKAYLEAVEKSDFMKKRATTRMRDLAEVNNTVQDQGKVRDFLDKGGYAMMLAMQSAVDLPTWWGGYEKAINDGKDEIDAVAMADQAVIDAQGSGLQKDLSSIERATGAIRLLTGFMSFMNTTLNVNYRVFKSEQSVPAKAFDLVMVNAIPVALSMILAAALTPGDSGDDDPEKVAKKLAADGLGFMLGQFVGLREIQQIGYAAMGMPQGDYGGAVGLRMFGDTLKLAKQVGQGSWDDAARKAAVNFAGDWFRLPAAQINRSVTGIEALAEGKTTNPGAILTGYQEPR